MQRKIFVGLGVIIFIVVLFALTNYFYSVNRNKKNNSFSKLSFSKGVWVAPDTSLIAHTHEGDIIRYGRDLILHTARYFGPQGTVAKISNGMNCDNCHIEAGTRIWGNNFSRVASVFPVYKSRSGKLETVEMKINDCFERSLNGEKPGDKSKEMAALIAYINWVGKDVSKDIKTPGSGTESLPFLNRPADTLKGKMVYIAKCQTCHGKNGEGVLYTNGKEYEYPPLWGNHSFNIGAGMYQLSKFAGYVKNNMPFGTTYKNPKLTNEQAWDVAAFVNSNPRPIKDLKNDWPDISKKPVDYPFGPYSDNFSEKQHKYGPFIPIMTEKKNLKKDDEKVQKNTPISVGLVFY
jgi:thiosulfate dehydrogenase